MKSKLILYVTLLIMHIPVCVCAVGDVEKKVEEAKSKVVSVTHDNIVMKAEAVRNAIGSTLGFRVEILNLDTRKNLILITSEDTSNFFRIDVINKKGLRVSPMPKRPVMINSRERRKTDYRHEVIFSRTSHAWFVPLPKMIRSDPRKLRNDENLVPIAKGEYEVDIVARVGYFRQEQGEASTSEQPEIRQLKLTLPRVTVIVNPDFLGEDIINAYVREGTRVRVPRKEQQ